MNAKFPLVEFNNNGKIPDGWLNALIETKSVIKDTSWHEHQVWINEEDAVEWLNPDDLKTCKIHGIVLLHVKRNSFTEMVEEDVTEMKLYLTTRELPHHFSPMKLYLTTYKFPYHFSPTEKTKYI